MLLTKIYTMSKKVFAIVIITLCSLISNRKALAQTKPISIQSTAVPFMLISPDARSGGMGNLSLAMSPE